MGFLPRLSEREMVKIFVQDGWCTVRQRGSHIILVKEGSFASLSVPDHREIATGTLRSLIRASPDISSQFCCGLREPDADCVGLRFRLKRYVQYSSAPKSSSALSASCCAAPRDESV